MGITEKVVDMIKWEIERNGTSNSLSIDYFIKSFGEKKSKKEKRIIKKDVIAILKKEYCMVEKEIIQDIIKEGKLVEEKRKIKIFF